MIYATIEAPIYVTLHPTTINTISTCSRPNNSRSCNLQVSRASTNHLGALMEVISILPLGSSDYIYLQSNLLITNLWFPGMNEVCLECLNLCVISSCFVSFLLVLCQKSALSLSRSLARSLSLSLSLPTCVCMLATILLHKKHLHLITCHQTYLKYAMHL